MPVRDLVLSPDASFLLVQSSDGVVLCDATGVVWYVNPAAGQLLRVTSNDMKGRSIVPLFAPEWRGDVAQMLLNPAEAAAELSVDILSQGGQRLEISLRCEVWPPDDSLRALFLRPGAEVTLSNWMASSPDAVYRELLDGLPSAVLEFDPTGIILYSNRQIEALLGYRPEEMIGRGALEFVAQEARARLRLALAEQQTNPRLVQHEYPLLAKDGSIKYATTHSSPVLRGGRLVCIRTVLNDVTEHRRRESVLRVSEARLTHVFQHLPVMMCALDDQRLVTVWNAECERVTGYRAQEILGNPEFAALLAGSSQNLMLALAGPEAPGKELRDFEIELRHNSGQPRTVLWSNVSRRVPIEGWSSWCMGLDVTAQKQVTQELHEYLSFLETLLSTIPSPVFYKDTSGRYLGCNDAFAASVLGLPKTAIIGKSLAELDPAVPPDIAKIYLQADLQVLKSGGVQDYEAPVRFADGIRRDCRLIKSVFRNKEGEPAGIVGIMFDLSEKNQMLADQRQLAAAVEQSPDAIVITDLQGVITYVNQAFTKVSGYTAAEAIGDRPSLLKSGRQSAELYTELWRTVSNGGVWSGRLVNRAKDGRLFIEDAKVLPAFDSSGVPTHYIAVKRDVTAVVELERQILSAQKLEAVGRLAAGIAHEINTPTQYVGDNTRFFENSFLQILIVVQWYDRLERAVRQGEPTGDVLRGLGEAKANSDLEFALDEIPKALEQSLEGIARITEIVAAMKEFSHPGSEEKTPFDLNAGIRSTTTVARNEWKYVATLELELALALPPVPCHPGDINQVVLNLVVNAAHAIADRRAAEGTQALGVIRVATAVEGSSAEIRISDSGTGIPESIREKIFEPFFTTKAVGKGTGQGLALAHNVVVDKHGGSIACESEVGVGTTFIIRLPLRDSKLAELELEGEPTHA